MDTPTVAERTMVTVLSLSQLGVSVGSLSVQQDFLTKGTVLLVRSSALTLHDNSQKTAGAQVPPKATPSGHRGRVHFHSELHI